jgi:hypothetical protein
LVKLLSRSAAPVKVLLVAGLLAVVMGAGWFGASTFAFTDDDDDTTDEMFIPHALGCVDRWGKIRIMLKDDECEGHYKYPILLASEEKVDATASYTRSASSTEPAGDDDNWEQVAVQCDPGDRATGGGAHILLGTQPNNEAGDNVALQSSTPLESDGTVPEDAEPSTGWFAAARELQNVPGDTDPSAGVSTTGAWNSQPPWDAPNGADSATDTAWTLFVYVICTTVLGDN